MRKEDEHLLSRNKFIASIYENFNQNSTQENFIKAVMAKYILEGIYFYSGFSFFYTLLQWDFTSPRFCIFPIFKGYKNTLVNLQWYFYSLILS